MVQGKKTVAGLVAAVAVTFGAGVFVAAAGIAQPSHDHSSHDHGAHDHGDHDHGDHEHAPVAGGRNDPFGLLGQETGVDVPDRDPCSVLTAGEAELVVGPVARAAESGVGVVGGQRVCTYSLAADPNLGVSLAITDSDADDKFEVLESYHLADGVTVPGLDDAIWVAPFKLLVVVEGDWLLSVQILVPGEQPEIARAKAISLAIAAIDRL